MFETHNVWAIIKAKIEWKSLFACSSVQKLSSP